MWICYRRNEDGLAQPYVKKRKENNLATISDGADDSVS